MSTEIYFSAIGEIATPKHSEFEIDSDFEKAIVVVYNASREPGFLIVKDEEKPVFIIGGFDNRDQCIWKIDVHCSGKYTRRSGKYSARYMTSSEFEVQVTQRVDITTGSVPQPLVILRRNKCTYYAGDTSKIAGDIQRITLEDVLAFVAGDIAWEDLEKCCTILSWNKEAELLQEERIKDYALKLKAMTADRDRFISTNNEYIKEYDRLSESMQAKLDIAIQQGETWLCEREELKKELRGIPEWVRSFFKWWRR